MNERDRAKRFGTWIDGRFEALQISEREFARRAGVTATTPRTWRAGLSVPNYENAAGVARALGVSLNEVLVAAGYINTSDAGVANDIDTIEMRALWEQAGPQGRQALLALGRALPLLDGARDGAAWPVVTEHPARQSGLESA